MENFVKCVRCRLKFAVVSVYLSVCLLAIFMMNNHIHINTLHVWIIQKIPSLCVTARASFWACCAAPPPPKPKNEKKVKKPKQKEEKKSKKEKKTKKDNKFDDRYSLPVGFECNGGNEINPVVIGDGAADGGDDVDRCLPEGKPQSQSVVIFQCVHNFHHMKYIRYANVLVQMCLPFMLLLAITDITCIATCVSLSVTYYEYFDII